MNHILKVGLVVGGIASAIAGAISCKKEYARAKAEAYKDVEDRIIGTRSDENKEARIMLVRAETVRDEVDADRVKYVDSGLVAFEEKNHFQAKLEQLAGAEEAELAEAERSIDYIDRINAVHKRYEEEVGVAAGNRDVAVADYNIAIEEAKNAYRDKIRDIKRSGVFSEDEIDNIKDEAKSIRDTAIAEATKRKEDAEKLYSSTVHELDGVKRSALQKIEDDLTPLRTDIKKRYAAQKAPLTRKVSAEGVRLRDEFDESIPDEKFYTIENYEKLKDKVSSMDACEQHNIKAMQSELTPWNIVGQDLARKGIKSSSIYAIAAIPVMAIIFGICEYCIRVKEFVEYVDSCRTPQEALHEE